MCREKQDQTEPGDSLCVASTPAEPQGSVALDPATSPSPREGAGRGVGSTPNPFTLRSHITPCVRSARKCAAGDGGTGSMPVASAQTSSLIPPFAMPGQTPISRPIARRCACCRPGCYCRRGRAGQAQEGHRAKRPTGGQRRRNPARKDCRQPGGPRNRQRPRVPGKVSIIASTAQRGTKLKLPLRTNPASKGRRASLCTRGRPFRVRFCDETEPLGAPQGVDSFVLAISTLWRVARARIGSRRGGCACAPATVAGLRTGEKVWATQRA